MLRKSVKADKVWKYLLKNKDATALEIAKACKVSPSYVRKLKNKISTPKEVLEKEANRVDRCDLLREALSLTDGDRLKDYGSPVDNHNHIARIFTAITDKHVTGRDVAIMHQATKLARRQTSPTIKDHYIDNMAYVGIEYECAVEEEEGMATFKHFEEEWWNTNTDRLTKAQAGLAKRLGLTEDKE